MRPFKDIKEFTAMTGKTIGSIIKLRYKADHDDTITGIITSFEPVIKTIAIGSCEYYLDDIFNLYEYFNENIGKWLPFGVEEMDILKFKIGKYYLGSNGTYIKILDRYTDKENREHVEIQDFDARNCPTGWTTHFCIAINPLDPNDRERCIETVRGHVAPNKNDEIWRAENECEKIKLLPAIYRPARFKTGKEYFFCDAAGFKVHVFINAKYRDPIGHKIKVVANCTTLGEVHTDEKGDEIAKLSDGKIVNAKNEVKE